MGTRGPNLGTYIAEGVERERQRERGSAGVLVSGAAFAAQEGWISSVAAVCVCLLEKKLMVVL